VADISSLNIDLIHKLRIAFYQSLRQQKISEPMRLQMKQTFPLQTFPLLISSLIGLLFATESCQLFKKRQVDLTHQEVEAFTHSIGDSETECFFFLPEQFERQLVALFEFQGLLLNDAIALSFTNISAEDFDLCRTNLFDNVHEIGVTFSTVYGSNVGSQIETLLNEQTELLFAQIAAIHCRNRESLKNNLAQSYSNGYLFIEFLNILNPYFSAQTEKYMMDEHILLQVEQIKAYSQGYLKRGEELKCRSINQFVELAIHISKAVEKQMTDCT
jgi:hypothetical protein